MPTHIFKPTMMASARTNAPVTVTGGTNQIVVTQDGLDTTYDRFANGGSALPVDWADATPDLIPFNGERVVSVCPYCRSKSPGPSVARILAGAMVYPGGPIVEGAALSLPAGSAVVTSYALAPQLGQFLDPLTGAEWNPYFGADLLTVTLRDPNAYANAAYWYEAGLYVYTTKKAAIAAPTVSPAVGGTVTTTAFPTFSAVVSALVESWQLYAGGEFCTAGRVEFSVYRAADAGAGASPPAGVTPVLRQVATFDCNTYIDGVTLSTVTVSAKAAAPLPDDNYVVYARAVRDHPSGQDTDPTGASAWTAYQRLAWSQLIGTPQAPGAGYAADDASQGIFIHAYLSAPAAYTQSSGLVYVERAVGGVWRAVRGMTGVAVPAANDHLVGEDFECARSAANTYRLRSSYVNATDGTLAYSPWAEFTVTGPAPLGTGWNLKTVEAPTFSWLSAGILAEPSESDQTQATIFYPLDRPHPVVVKGSAGGWSGSYDFIARGVSEVAVIRGLALFGQGLLLVETAFGDTFYATLTGLSVKRQGTSAYPSMRLAGTLTFVQVDCDLATEN